MDTLEFVAIYARKYKKELLVAVVSMIGLVGAQLVVPWVVRELITLVKEEGWSVGTGVAIRRLALILLGAVGLMLSMNWRLMLLTMIPVPLVVLAMRGFGQYMRPAFREWQEDLAELNATTNDNLSGIREIKAFTQEPIERKRVGKRIQNYRDSMLNVLRLMAIFSPGVEFTSSLGTVVVIYFGGRLVFQQTLPLEDLVTFFLYLDLF